MAERDEEYRRMMERLDRTEQILWGGPGMKEPGLVYIVNQLTQSIATQSLQFAEMAKETALRVNTLTDHLSKKMDVVLDDNNQPVSISMLSHDLGLIKKYAVRILTYLAIVGVIAFLILGRELYSAFPILQHFDK